jgi:hypothetical protein
VVHSACVAPSTDSEDVVECDWPRDFAANRPCASPAGAVKSLFCCELASTRVSAGVVIGRKRARPTQWSRPKTIVIAAMAEVLASAPRKTSGRSRLVGLSRMDAKAVAGLLHK